MKTNIAEKTDLEIYGIIENLTKKDNYTREDEMCIKVRTPFEINPDGNTEERKSNAFLVLYPELLSYYSKEGWVTIPWICAKIDIQKHKSIGESEQRQVVKWFVEELTNAGYKPFHDEDAFAGYATRVENKYDTTIKMYINPSFPEGYWSNHTL